jgi:Mg-chelatase subunit ChlD
MNPVTEIVVLMDASGSMGCIREDAVGGFNAFLADQKKEDGDASLTVTFFDTERFEHWQQGVDLKACPDLGSEYRPVGGTPLLDATGRTIEELGQRLAAMPEPDRPGRVMVIVLTDGHENASQVYSKERIREMIRHQEEVYSWEFVFLGANVDAFAEGHAMGYKMANIAGYTSSKKGVRAAFDAISGSARKYRRGGKIDNLEREIGEND